MWGVMHFPASGGLGKPDEHLKKRHDLLIARRAMALCATARKDGLDSSDEIAISLADFEYFLDAPPVDEISASETAASELGLIAGEILLYLMAASKDRPKKATIKQAREHVRRINKHYLANPMKGKALPVSRSYLIKIWNEYGPVSHLWAAFWISPEVPQAGIEPYERLARLIPDGAALRRFLAIAEHFRRFGESFVASHQGRAGVPVFARFEAWTPPEGLDLPSCSPLPVELPPDP